MTLHLSDGTLAENFRLLLLNCSHLDSFITEFATATTKGRLNGTYSDERSGVLKQSF